MKLFGRIAALCLCLLPFASAAQEPKVGTVSVPVTVSDRDGRYVAGLAKDDFTILAGGQPQKITSFAREDEPVSVALILDTSESTRGVLDDIRDAARDFIDLLNPADKCLVASVDSKVKVLYPLGSDRRAAKAAAGRLQTDEREGTVVYSAIDQVAREGFTGAVGRKVVIVLSDGKDFGSSIGRDELFRSLEESEVTIYSVFYQTGSVKVDAKGAEIAAKKKATKPEKTPKKKKGYSITISLPREDTFSKEEIKLADKTSSAAAVSGLEQLSDATAGSFYMSDAPNLGRIFKLIATELRQQYRLAFAPKDKKMPEDVVVRVNGRPEVVVRVGGRFRPRQL